MKEKIMELAKEVWEYSHIPIEIPAEDLQIEAEAGSNTYGVFHVRNAEGHPMKGRIYLHGNTLLRITKAEFSGRDCLIPYEFCAEGVLCGETQKCIAEVYADCGYLSVECRVQVIPPYVNSSIGRIDNLMRFTELCKKDWKEALQIFRSDDFERVFLQKEERMKKIYEGLLKGEGKSNALEEFLIAARRKQPVQLMAQKNHLSFSKITQEQEEIIVLKRSTWGYGKYTVSSDCDFLCPDRGLLWADAFVGDECSLGVRILPQHFHQGKNKGRILLESTTDFVEITVEITQELSEEQELYLRRRRHEKELIIQILKGFRGFLAGYLKGESYCSRQKNLLEQMGNLLSNNDRELLKIHLKEASGEREAAAEMLRKLQLSEEPAKIFGEHCREAMEQRKPLSKESATAYGCYLYFSVCLYEQEGPDERIIFLRYLNQLRERYREDTILLYLYIMAALKTVPEQGFLKKEKRMEEMAEYLLMLRSRAEHSMAGTDSSFLYILACHIWNHRPDMLMRLDRFSIPAIFAGIRYKMLSKSLKLQFVYLAGSTDRYDPLVFRALCQLYQQNPSDDILNAMLKHLIRGQQAGERYHEYFRLGIEKRMRITQLYEYFIYSMGEEERKPLPQQVLTYFQYACALPDSKKAALYANIINNRDQDMQAYLAYQEQIEKFALEQVAEHKISRNLAVLYAMLDSTNLDIASQGHLAQIIFRQEILCHQPGITGFYVLYEELKGEEYVPLSSGRALVNLMTDQAVLLFEDSSGGRHYSTDYTANRLFQLDELREKCMETNPESGLLVVSLLKNAGQKKNFNGVELSAMEKALSMEELSETVRGNVWMALLDYYYENFDEELLKSLLMFRLTVAVPYRKRLAEICISAGEMEQAYEILQEGRNRGILQKISAEKLSCFLRWKLRDGEGTPEEQKFLVKACYVLFQKGIADRQQTAFLLKHMEGTVGEMLTLWESREVQGEELKKERCLLAEAILSHLLFAGRELSRFRDVFLSYYKNRESFKYTERYHLTELIVRAFLFVYASAYLHDQEEEDSEIFMIMFQELNRVHMTACKYAMLKYFSKKKEGYTEEQLSWIEANAKECVETEMVFPFFRDFGKEVRLPSGIRDACYVSYTAPASNIVTLHYCYRNAQGWGEYETQVMKNLFQGIHIRRFLLFYDEKLLYYITEEQDGEEIARTPEMEIMGEQEPGGKENSFKMINMILAAKDMRDDVTMRQGMEHYIETAYAQRQLFAPFLYCKPPEFTGKQ